jgi:hypothetical protein
MYRNIDTTFWSDPKIRMLSFVERYLFLYYLTNHHAHLSGIYFIPEEIAVYESGLKEAFRKAFDSLVELFLIKFDHEKDIIWVVNMLRYQASSPNTFKSADTQLYKVHNTILINDFMDHYPNYKWTHERLSEGFLKPLSPAPVSDPISNAVPVQPKVTHKKILKVSEYSESFLKFWELYPRKECKKDSFEIWEAGNLEIKADEIMAGLQRHIPLYATKEMNYIPQPTTWLNQRRWEDNPSASNPIMSMQQSKANRIVCTELD